MRSYNKETINTLHGTGVCLLFLSIITSIISISYVIEGSFYIENTCKHGGDFPCNTTCELGFIMIYYENGNKSGCNSGIACSDYSYFEQTKCYFKYSDNIPGGHDLKRNNNSIKEGNNKFSIASCPTIDDRSKEKICKSSFFALIVTSGVFNSLLLFSAIIISIFFISFCKVID